jgi:hypothetical protein
VFVCSLIVACGDPAAPDAFKDPGSAPDALTSPNFALTFSSSYVNVPDHDLLDLTRTWTLEAWVNPVDATTGVDQDIISKWAGVTTASYILQIDATGKLRLVTNNGVTQSIILSNASLTDNTWQHVAASFNNGTVRLYLNGGLDRTVTSVLTPQASTEPVAFGREGNYSGGTLAGRIDEVRIWNVVRSAAKIAQFRSRKVPNNAAGLVGYWRFNQGSGQIARDATGHGLHGRLGETTATDSWDPTWTTLAAPVR